MLGGWLDRRNPWFPAFLLSAAALVSSAFALGTALFQLTNDAPAISAAEPAPSGASSTGLPADIAVTYSGALPVALAGSSLRPVGSGAKPDVTFVPGQSDGVVTRVFIPVAALGTGVESLTGPQLKGLLDGSTKDWQDVGGLPGKVSLAAVVTPSDPGAQALLQQWMGNVAEIAATFGSYADLRTAMKIDSGMLALVPLDEVRFSQSAIAVDGVDPLRGKRDLAAWPYVERIGVVGNTERGKGAAIQIAAAIAQKIAPVTTIVATGDILQSRCSLTQIRATGDWGAALRGPVADYLKGADLALGSLDGSIQDVGTPYGCVSTTNLTSPPEVMEALTIAGIDEVTVATNHVFDCGETYCGDKAFLRTLELLGAANIKVVGGGKNLEEALTPAIFEVNGVRFGVLGFDDIAAEDLEATATRPGTAPLDDSYDDEQASEPREPAFYQSPDKLELTRFADRIHQLKATVDVVIVQVQSGTEDTHTPSPRSIKALRAAADAGADLVVGNQAHWVQAVEVRDDSFIAYALGNFIFDQTHTPEHTQGYLLEATFRGKVFVGARFVPYQIEDKYRPVFATPSLRTKILADVFTAAGRLPAP